MALLEGNCWFNDTLVGFFFEYLQTTEFKGNAEVLFIGPEVTQEGMKLKLNVSLHIQSFFLREQVIDQHSRYCTIPVAFLLILNSINVRILHDP